MAFNHWKDTGLEYKGCKVMTDESIPKDEIHGYTLKDDGSYELQHIVRLCEPESPWAKLKRLVCTLLRKS